ncbi:M42 family peptidase [Hathewaya histolytica]|uniref:Peptidase M42 n=1 Tax=Hathewaya histolytica TaxID=1498 RepID=A0A4U9QXT3_HATHI|nr:M42 family peptidase [Hathewaya histolytica]VTQ82948.1 peptidase M42 [Hathewaya histolytica]
MYNLRHLVQCSGISGNEYEIVRYIKSKLLEYKIDIHEDSMGNIIAKKYNGLSSKKVMICAHMDEVGLIITDINDNGLLCFEVIGGINTSMLSCKRIYIGIEKIHGVITPFSKVVNENGKTKVIEELYIDIGVSNKLEAMDKVKIGDYVEFENSFSYIGTTCISSKALDDRVGCAIILELLKQDFYCNINACFTVQEEIGLRGASRISQYLDSDLCIVLDCTPTCIPQSLNSKEEELILGKGPVITLLDSKTIYNKDLIIQAKNIAKKHNIPIQIKTTISGSTDGAAIQYGICGCRTIVISVPCRYIHTSGTFINLDDLNNLYLLVYNFLRELQ